MNGINSTIHVEVSLFPLNFFELYFWIYYTL